MRAQDRKPYATEPGSEEYDAQHATPPHTLHLDSKDLLERHPRPDEPGASIFHLITQLRASNEMNGPLEAAHTGHLEHANVYL